METLENEDLVSFINKEREARSNLNISKAYRYYCKCANKGIWEIYSRFKIMKDINIDIAILFGSNMIFHIFWVLINYTNNIKLTIFLIERAVLLFIEFVVMSRNSQNTIGIDFVPNIQDAMNFAYKKTIGPINPSITKDKEVSVAMNASYDIKYILYEFFLKTIYNQSQDSNTINEDLTNNEEIFTYITETNDNNSNKNVLIKQYFINEIDDFDIQNENNENNENNYFSDEENEDENINVKDSNDKYNFEIPKINEDKNEINKNDKNNNTKLDYLYNNICSNDVIYINQLETNVQKQYENMEEITFFLSGIIYDFYAVFNKKNTNVFVYNTIVNILNIDNYNMIHRIVFCKLYFETFFNIYDKINNFKETINILNLTLNFIVKEDLYKPSNNKLSNNNFENNFKNNLKIFSKIANNIIKDNNIL